MPSPPGVVKSLKPRHYWTGDGSRAKKERFKRGIKETR